MDNDGFFDAFNDWDDLTQKREECPRCRRPTTVCICSHLPIDPIQLKRSRLHILQHPNEENRPLHTVSILRSALHTDSCYVYKGKSFSQQKYPDLHQVFKANNTVLLYPSKNATKLDDLRFNGCCNVVLVDGTWKQASSMFARNPVLDTLTKVQIEAPSISEYVVRTQPNDKCLSTVECAAIALSHTEDDLNLKEVLLKPLRAMCQFQLNHGAVVHQSKEAVARLKMQ
ncbi:tRNA-uridine aminocarboxypropyltransferase 2-like isoform X1 [Ciona intestinalis]